MEDDNRQKRQDMSKDFVTEHPEPYDSPRPLPQYFDDSDPSVMYSSDSEGSVDWEDTDEVPEYNSMDEMPSIGANSNAEDTTCDSPASLKWTSKAGEYLRGSYGCGSRATKYREQQRQAKIQQEASKHYNIKSLFQRQHDLNLCQKVVADQASKVIPLGKVDRGKLARLTEKEEAQVKASEDLKRLIELPTEQKKKYGYILPKNQNFYRRHLLVLNFLWIQQQREGFPGLDRRGLARVVAVSNMKGGKTAQMIVHWERSWVEQRIIPERKSRDTKYNASWMNEEDIACAARDFARSQREGKSRNFNRF